MGTYDARDFWFDLEHLDPGCLWKLLVYFSDCFLLSCANHLENLRWPILLPPHVHKFVHSCIQQMGGDGINIF